MLSPHQVFEGGCLCGAVRYCATGSPYHITHCHCPSCRQASGSAFVSWVSFRTKEFSFKQGKPTYFGSSEKVLRGFCDRCSTSLTYQMLNSDEIDVTICSLDNPESVHPEDRTWVQYQLSWVKLADELPHYQQNRPSNS